MRELRSEAVPLSVAIPAQHVPGSLADAKDLVSGLLFTVAVAVLGTALFTALLVVLVVASPFIAGLILFAIVRHRRLARPHRVVLRAA